MVVYGGHVGTRPPFVRNAPCMGLDVWSDCAVIVSQDATCRRRRHAGVIHTCNRMCDVAVGAVGKLTALALHIRAISVDIGLLDAVGTVRKRIWTIYTVCTVGIGAECALAKRIVVRVSVCAFGLCWRIDQDAGTKDDARDKGGEVDFHDLSSYKKCHASQVNSGSTPLTEVTPLC